MEREPAIGLEVYDVDYTPGGKRSSGGEHHSGGGGASSGRCQPGVEYRLNVDLVSSTSSALLAVAPRKVSNMMTARWMWADSLYCGDPFVIRL
jgi:hypothetical protein